MIKNFKQYNEGINHLLVGPTKDEVWEQLGFPHSFNTPEEFVKYLMEHVTKKQTPMFGATIVARYNGKLIYENEFNNYKLWVSDFVLSVIMGIFDYSSYDAFTVIEKYFRSKPEFKTHGVYELGKYYRREEDIVHESVKSLLVGPTEEEGWRFLKDKYKGKGDGEYQLLINACKKGIMIGLKEIFDDKKISVNFDNFLPMRVAAQYGQVETMKFLQDRGADIHANGDVPLLLAIDSGEVDSVKYILDDKNVDMSENMLIIPITDSDDNYTLVKTLIGYGKDFSGSIYLSTAAKRNNYKIVKLLLETYTYDKYTLRTAINYAVSNNSLKTVELLKQYFKE